MAKGIKELIRALPGLSVSSCLLCGAPLENNSCLCPSCESHIYRYPHERCAVCSAPLVSFEGTCGRCREQSYAFGRNYSLFLYSGLGKTLLHEYKFQGNIEAARWFSAEMLRYIREEFPGFTVIPTPGSRKKLKERNKRPWDQISVIASLLKREGIPVLPVLSREKSATQKSLGYEERLKNLKGKIRVSGDVSGLPVLLIDDVFTSGATMNECASALLASGARSVDCLTLFIEG